MTYLYKKALSTSLSLLTFAVFQIALPFNLTSERVAYGAESKASSPSWIQQILTTHFFQGFMPPGEGAPQETTTAGSRREMWCEGDRAPMRSLMPTQNYGLTFATHPTIFLEIPQTVASHALLVVQNEADGYNQDVILAIPDADEHGVVSFQLPQDAAPLDIGKNYRWSLAIMCQGYLDPSDPFFSGWVQRVEQTPDITESLETLSESEQIQWLGDRGYWYDMVSLILKQ